MSSIQIKKISITDVETDCVVNAAGIGSDCQGGYSSHITINGGIITANGGNSGAGIGGGSAAYASDITINGGTVIAKGKGSAAGIGSGVWAQGISSNITIIGGTVSAIGGEFGAGIGGDDGCECGNVIITGGSVNVVAGSSYAYKIGGSNGAVIPTNGTNDVYLLTIENPNSEAVTIDGSNYTPVNHKAVDSDTNLYAYLPEKPISNPCVVEVGSKTTKYYYDTTKSAWLAIVDKPVADTTTFTYDGTEQTYNITASDYYTVTGNKQTNAGDYTVTVSLNDKDNTVWSDGTTADLTYTFKINKQSATVTPPTAPTAISYGETLADTGLTAGWTWEKGSTYMPKVIDNTLSAYMLVDDDNNYDYSNISGISYKVGFRFVCTINLKPTFFPTGSAVGLLRAAAPKTPIFDKKIGE